MSGFTLPRINVPDPVYPDLAGAQQRGQQFQMNRLQMMQQQQAYDDAQAQRNAFAQYGGGLASSDPTKRSNVLTQMMQAAPGMGQQLVPMIRDERDAREFAGMMPGGGMPAAQAPPGPPGTLSAATLEGLRGGATGAPQQPQQRTQAQPPAEMMPHFEAASRATGVPVALLIAQAGQESGFRADARGAAGEIGIMQVRPSTAAQPGYGVQPIDPSRLTDPAANIMFGAQYLAGRGRANGATDLNDPAQRAVALRNYNGTGQGGDPNYVANVSGRLPGGAAPPVTSGGTAAASTSAAVVPSTVPTTPNGLPSRERLAQFALMAARGNQHAARYLTAIAPLMTAETQLEQVRQPDGSMLFVPRAQAAGMTSAPERRDVQQREFGGGPQGPGIYVINQDGGQGRFIGPAPDGPVQSDNFSDGEHGPGRYVINRDGSRGRFIGQTVNPTVQTMALARELRTELTGTRAAQDYAAVEPRMMAIRQAANVQTRAADLDLVFAIANLFDPNSVVREGEVLTMQRTGTLPEQVMGSLSRVREGAALGPDTRAALVAQAESRFRTFEDPYRQQVERYQRLATRAGVDPHLVHDPLPPPQNRYAGTPGRTPPAPPAPGTTPPPPPARTGSVPRVATTEEGMRLPSGTLFEGPDGRQHVRP